MRSTEFNRISASAIILTIHPKLSVIDMTFINAKLIITGSPMSKYRPTNKEKMVSVKHIHPIKAVRRDNLIAVSNGNKRRESSYGDKKGEEERYIPPIGIPHDSVGLIVMIHLVKQLLTELRLEFVSSNGRGALQGFRKVGVNGGGGDGFESLQFARSTSEILLDKEVENTEGDDHDNHDGSSRTHHQHDGECGGQTSQCVVN